MSVRIMSFKAGQLLWIVLAAAAAILIALFFILRGGSGDTKSEAAQYVPGVYTTSVSFGDQAVTLEMTCSEDAILSIAYDVPESMREVYPLVETCCSSLGSQLEAGTPVSALSVESAYTDTADYIMLAIERLLDMCQK